MKRDINVYQDEHSGGWILEALDCGRWYQIGVFGTYAAASKQCASMHTRERYQLSSASPSAYLVASP
jgi:hypothetical protein